MKNNTKHVAVIVTPLQYINLLEFYHQNNKLDKNKCVLILISHYKKSITQIEEIGNLESFEKTVKPMVFSSSRILSFFYTLVVFFKYKNRIPILGFLHNSWCRSFLTDKTIPYVLDDGSGSINIFNNRNRDNYDLVEKDYRPTNKLSLMTEVILKPKKSFDHPINFFTVYNGLEASEKDSIRLNKYSFLQSQNLTKEKVQVNECWFIGAPLVDLGLIDHNVFMMIINNISLYFMKKNVKLRYFGHRTEKLEVINEENIKFEHNEMPFEIFYQMSDEKPKFLSSFLSSVLKNIEVMDKTTEIFSFYLPENCRTDKLKKRWHINQKIYDYYENHTRIQVIKDYL